MIATVILARLLTPSDFGLLAMVTTFSSLLLSFLQIGFPEAVAQREQLDHLLASNLFWISVGLGLLLMTGFASASPLLAKAFHDPRVVPVALGVSPAILLTSTSVLHLALLKRAMRFPAVSVVDIVARAISVVASIVLAAAGWGYWALVVGVIAQPMVLTIGAWALCQWLPGLPRRGAGTASVAGFAIGVNGRGILAYLTTNVDNVLVGWRFGPSGLGFYKKAYELFVLPSNQFLSVYSVAVSALSRLIRNPAQYKRYFLSGLSMLAFVGMGVGVGLTLVGNDLVRLLLGAKWETTGRIFTCFGPGIGFLLIYRTHGILQLSLGSTRRYVYWGIVELAVTGTLFLLALPWGPSGIAVAWSVSSLILTLPAFWYAGKPIQLGATAVLATIWKYVLASLLAGSACFAITRELPFLVATLAATGSLSRLLITSCLFVLLYFGGVILLHGGCDPFYQFASFARDIIPGGRGLPASRPVVDSTYGPHAPVASTPTSIST